MAGFMTLLRRRLHLSGESRLWVRRPPLGECEMREYSRHEGLRHRWIDHD